MAIHRDGSPLSTQVANPLSRSRVLRTNEVADRVGVSRTTLWRWERKGLLPPKRQVGPNVVGWLEEDIEAFIRTRPTTDGRLPAGEQS